MLQVTLFSYIQLFQCEVSGSIPEHTKEQVRFTNPFIIFILLSHTIICRVEILPNQQFKRMSLCLIQRAQLI